jgi:phosphatidylcholine synthase
MTQNKKSNSALHYMAAWAVHLFTASGAFIGVLTLNKIYQHEYVFALFLMTVTVFIDAVDGSFARLVQVKKILPQIDGALLDNITDYLNYVVTPCFFLLVKPDMLPQAYSFLLVAAISICSAYQFCQSDAKTPDHFFKGFPCYWNIAVLYLFLFDTSMHFNALLLSGLCVLIFVPVKYVYPSRLDYLTESFVLKVLMHCCSIIYGISTLFLLISYPKVDTFWMDVSLSYVVMYLCLSFYRTYYPMFKAKMNLS